MSPPPPGGVMPNPAITGTRKPRRRDSRAFGSDDDASRRDLVRSLATSLAVSSPQRPGSTTLIMQHPLLLGVSLLTAARGGVYRICRCARIALRCGEGEYVQSPRVFFPACLVPLPTRSRYGSGVGRDVG